MLTFDIFLFSFCDSSGIEGKMVNGRSIEMHSNFKEVKIAVAGTTRNHVNSKRTKVHDFDDEGRDFEAVYRVILRFCSHTVPFRIYTILVFMIPRYIHCFRYRVSHNIRSIPSARVGKSSIIH